MKTIFYFLLLFAGLFVPMAGHSQDYLESDVYTKSNEIKTIFRSGKYASGGYAALNNKFTTINGQFANMPEVYGGWFVNHKFMVGLGFAATTNSIEVPAEYSTLAGADMKYIYGQAGLMLEYTFWSNSALHIAFQCFNGGAFTAQYHRDDYYHSGYWQKYEWAQYQNGNFDPNYTREHSHDVNLFYVTEPGVKLELNIFKWMRFCPGVSYRAAFGSNGIELKDDDVSGVSMNLGLKFGRF